MTVKTRVLTDLQKCLKSLKKNCQIHSCDKDKILMFRACCGSMISTNIIKAERTCPLCISLKKALDMLSLLLVSVLVCIFHVNIIRCHYDLTNVAYSKPVTLSALFDNDSRYRGFKAVNGIFSDLTATAAERSPWLRIDLGTRFEINEIEVFARSDCCGKSRFLFCFFMTEHCKPIEFKCRVLFLIFKIKKYQNKFNSFEYTCIN